MNYTTREKKPFILWTHMIIHYFCLIFFRFDKSSTDIKLLVSMLVILDFVKTYVVCFQKIIFFMNTLYDFFPF